MNSPAFMEIQQSGHDCWNVTIISNAKPPHRFVEEFSGELEAATWAIDILCCYPFDLHYSTAKRLVMEELEK